MLKFFKEGSVLLSLICVAALSQAQLKPLTDDQYFKGDFKSILNRSICSLKEIVAFITLSYLTFTVGKQP